MFLFINKRVSWIPGVGRVVGLLSIGISFVAGFAITLFVIALAWLRYKPVVSVLLIVAGIVFILGIIKIKNIIKNKLDSKEQEQHNNVLPAEIDNVNDIDKYISQLIMQGSNNYKEQQDQQQQNQQQNPQQNKNEMSKENAQQLLNSIMQDEKDIQDKVKKQIQIQGKKLDKDW